MANYDLDFWRAMTPWQAKLLLSGFDRPWWVAGGWAIDLHLGRQTREHHDLDIGVFACDQLSVQGYLARRGWELHCADPPGRLRPWAPEEDLPAAVHDIWCRRSPESPWELQLMLNPGHGGHWISRRDPAIRLSCAEAIRESPDGIPYLAPEVQLYFKAKHRLDKDESDLANALPALGARALGWLAGSIRRTDGAHPWLGRL